MNYRHIYHAGNFADVLKHIVLMLCLDYLQRKDGGLCFIDAHGGAGIYDLGSKEAARTKEWERGVGRIWNATGLPPDVQLYTGCIADGVARHLYPGSPLLIARRLRAQDRLVTAELHPPAFEALNSALRPFPGARAVEMDAYECIRANIPPRERRGLVLIDPPFERKDEFQTLARQMREWKRRWTTGVYFVWYPIKAHLPVRELRDAALNLGLRRTWNVEILIGPQSEPDGLKGCGLILFNAPYTIPERVEALLPVLKDAMTLDGAASSWLVPD